MFNFSFQCCQVEATDYLLSVRQLQCAIYLIGIKFTDGCDTPLWISICCKQSIKGTNTTKHGEATPCDVVLKFCRLLAD